MTSTNKKNATIMINSINKNVVESSNETRMEIDVENLKLLKANSQLIQTTFKTIFKYGNLFKSNEKTLSPNTSGVKQELFLNGPIEYREKAQNYINSLCQPEFVQFVSLDKTFLKEKIESNTQFLKEAVRDYQVHYFVKNEEIVLNGRVDDVNRLKSRIQMEIEIFLKNKSPDDKKKETPRNPKQDDDEDDDIIFIGSTSPETKKKNELPSKSVINLNETPQIIIDNSFRENDSSNQSQEKTKMTSSKQQLKEKAIDDDIQIIDTVSLANSLNMSLKIESFKLNSSTESLQDTPTENQPNRKKFDQQRPKFQNKNQQKPFKPNFNNQNRIGKSKYKNKNRNNNFRYFHHIIPEVQDCLNNKNTESLSKNFNLISKKPTKTISSAQLRFIVIDGNNVAIEHGKGSGNGKAFSAKGLKLVVEYFLARGHNQIKIFVPRFRRGATDQYVPTRNPEILDELEEQGYLAYTPSRFVNQKLILPYDDRFIIKAAIHHNAVIVSNDNFRDLQEENTEWKTYIQRNLLQFTYVGDLFMVADDPFGKGGPSLNHFLTSAFK